MANNTSGPYFPLNLHGTKLFSFISLALLLSFTTLGNIIVCLAIKRMRRLHTSSNILIVNMALGDIVYSLSTLPLSMVLLCFPSQWPLGKIGNIVFDATWFSFLILSFLNVTTISLERFIAITKPFTYKTKATKQRVVYVCLCIWAYVTLLTVALTFTFRDPSGVTYSFLIPGQTYYTVLIFHAGLVFIFVPFFYAKIYSIARKHELDIRKQDEKMRRSFYREMKATWTVGLVIFLFLLVWLPFLINQFVDFEDIFNGVWDTKNSVMCYITYCNGPVNILVYSGWNREIRRAIIKLLSPSTDSIISSTSNNHRRCLSA